MTTERSSSERFFERALAAAVLGSFFFSLVLVLLPALSGDLFQAAYARRLAGASLEPAYRAYLQFVYGVLGAVMIGWFVLIGFVLVGPFRAREPWSWWALLASVSTWFVTDTAHSLARGFWENALLNLVFVVLLGLPLLALRPAFAGRRP